MKVETTKVAVKPSKLEVTYDCGRTWLQLSDNVIVFQSNDGRLVYQEGGGVGSVAPGRWRYRNTAMQDAVNEFLEYLDGRIEWMRDNLDDIDCAIRHDEASYLRDRLDNMITDETMARANSGVHSA